MYPRLVGTNYVLYRRRADVQALCYASRVYITPKQRTKFTPMQEAACDELDRRALANPPTRP
jgi:hypothetical protein